MEFTLLVQVSSFYLTKVDVLVFNVSNEHQNS